jgi:hypothetical protein
MLLRELFEAPGKTAVLAFGRLNPPTVGHAKLVDAITSQEGDHYLFLSQTQKPKTDPLDFATKMKFAKQFFPGVNVGHPGVRTPVQALEKLQSLGYTDIIFIAGSDRVDGFQKLFDTYNGQPDKAGNVPFKFNSIKVVSAGERDPDADDVSGMSASKMRAAAAQGELETFAQGVPNKKLAKTMFDAVRKGMGVTEPVEESDLSPEDEDEFHTMLDKLVHKYFGHSSDEKKAKKKEVDEILGFATKTPKRATIKKKRPPEELSVKDKLAKRRAMAAKGNPDAFKSGKLNDDAPPGREKQVKKLKKKFDDPGAPYAIAWAQHNKHGKPKK